jgi:6-pyruvoyltetrahydropterin/6-carboxytetrahydropterin synthase
VRYSIRISKRFEFCASHELRSLQGHFLPNGSEHPCARNHGHNYVVELVLEAETLDEHGMVLDYNHLDPFKKYIDQFDHRNLNEMLRSEPTAENLAAHFYDYAYSLWSRLVASVSVSETPKTWAMVSRLA